MAARGPARAGVGIAGIPKAETKVGRKVGTKVGAKEAGAGEARAAAGWWMVDSLMKGWLFGKVQPPNQWLIMEVNNQKEPAFLGDPELLLRL